MTPIATKSARATKTVLIVDDEPAIVRMLKDALGMFRHDHGYTVEIACDGVDALAALKRHQFDLVLLDMYMPRMSGLELLEEMRRLKVSARRPHADGQRRRAERRRRAVERHLRVYSEALRPPAPRAPGLARGLVALGRLAATASRPGPGRRPC